MNMTRIFLRYTVPGFPIRYLRKDKAGHLSRLLLLLVVLHLYGITVLYAAPRYNVRRYSGRDYLPQNSINDLVVDTNGILWIATQGGLARFDGRDFTKYSSSNSILPIDRLDGLYYGSDQIVRIAVTHGQRRFFYIDGQLHIQKDDLQQQGKKIFGNTGLVPVLCDSLVYCRNAAGQTRRFSFSSFEGIKIYPFNVSQFYYVDHDSLLWLDHRALKFGIQKIGGVCGGFTLRETFFLFDKTGHARFWKGTQQLEAVAQSGLFKTLLAKIPQHLSTLFVTSDGAAGFIRIGSGVWRITVENGVWDAELLYDELNTRIKVTALYWDARSRILFIGTATEGLIEVRKNRFNNITFDSTSNELNNQYDQLAINTTTVLNWHHLYRPFTGEQHRLRESLFESGFCKTSDNRIWYSTPGYVCIADTQFRLLQKIPIRHAPGSLVAKVIAEDPDHTVWIGTTAFFGFIKDDEIIPVNLISAHFSRYDILSILFDRERIWIGHGNGVLVYNRKTGRIEDNWLAGRPVVALYRARDSSIWASTYGKGIYKYTGKDFVQLPLDLNKSLLFAHGFIEDHHGFFWIPTNSGLIQCQKQELEQYREDGHTSVYYFLYKNVGPSDEFNRIGASAIARLGDTVILPTLKGVITFNPDLTTPVLPNKIIMIESILVNGQPVRLPLAGLVLSAGTKRIEINIVAPYLGDAINNVVEYQLGDGSGDWYALSGRKMVFSSLSSGAYQLKIRKRTGFGRDNYVVKTIGITVKPFWYQTAWLPVLVAFGAFILAYVFIRIRVSTLKKSKRLLEKSIVERTAELEATIVELDLSEQELSNVNMIQQQAIAIILHDIKSPLQYMDLVARDLNRNIASFTAEELKACSNTLLQSSSNVIRFTNDLLEWLRLETKHNEPERELVDIPSLFRDIQTLYREIAAINNNILEIGVIEKEGVYMDRSKIYLVIRNLVDNAIKHCRDGRITLSCYPDKNTRGTTITVADTGKGFSAQELERWRQYTSSLPDFRKEKLGLSMVFYFVQLMNGSMDIESEAGKGTVIKIHLPG